MSQEGVHSGGLIPHPGDPVPKPRPPFSANDPVRRCEYWYRGTSHRLDIYMLVLAGRRFVTAAIGTQQVPVGHTAANAHWNLTAHFEFLT
jgi:hypothetical protein